jgi:hypothetical protein
MPQEGFEEVAIHRRRLASLRLVLVLGALFPLRAGAEVTKVVIERRELVADGQAFGRTWPYERLTGRIYFAFDPTNPRNQRIVDLDRAARNPAGLVEAWSDIVVLQPVDPARGNGFALLEVPNRGVPLALNSFNRCTGSRECFTGIALGDGFLFRRGYTVIWVGWQWNIDPPGFALHAPSAGDSIIGWVRTDWTILRPATVLPLAHRARCGALCRAYPTISLDDSAATLTVRSAPLSSRQVVPRAEWSFAREDSAGAIVPDPTSIRLAAGFEIGKIHELVYRARDPALAGLGLAVIRDVASWVKYDSQSAFPVRRIIGYGKSQSARFLREYLYEGFNTDEQGRQALDGILADVAGAGRGSFNYRFADPSRDRSTFDSFLYPVDLFPFSSDSEHDPITDARDGLLARPLRDRTMPRLMQVNTGYEYWGGAASLLHTDVEARRDLRPSQYERLYSINSGSHNVASLPHDSSTRLDSSPAFDGDALDTRFVLRALLEDLRAWVDGSPPPASRTPRIADGTLVPVDSVLFPRFGEVRRPTAAFVPRRLDYGARFAAGTIERQPPEIGEPYHILVPQVDRFGNDRGGVSTIETLAPVATYTGWQLRYDLPWQEDAIMAYRGQVIPLSPTEAARAVAGDPRPSLEHLYRSGARYHRAAAAAARTLIRDRFLLADDSTAAVARADSAWSWAQSLSH